MAGNDDRSERYELVERIAVGGMAEVFRAKTYGPHGFEKVVAIKRILPELVSNAEFERRFISEAKLACSLSHANIVHVFDFSRFGGSLYIVMEFVDGIDLARLLQKTRVRDEPIDLGAAMYIAIELFKGLDFAHKRNIIHRDISPANILLSRSGEVKIADFGIAKAAGEVTSRSGKHVMGKWRYMSPEQTRGRELDVRSDLFSAAAVVFEMFTGEPLFPGENAETIVTNIHERAMAPASSLRPDVPPALDALLLRALDRTRDQRIQRAAELWQSLVDISYSSSIKATSMKVAELVSRYADAGNAAPDPSPGPVSLQLIDQIINSELDESRDGGHAPSRVTVRDMRIPRMVTEDVYVPGGTGDGGITLVRGPSRGDGVPRWVLERTGVDGTIHGSKSSRERRAWRLAAVALAFLAGVGVGLWALLH